MSTRREFLFASTTLALTGELALSDPLPARANPALEDAPNICEELRQACIRNNCEDPEGGWIQDRLCHGKCQAEYLICRGQQVLHDLGDAIAEGTRWLADHPEVVAGALLIMGGIALLALLGPAGGLVVIIA